MTERLYVLSASKREAMAERAKKQHRRGSRNGRVRIIQPAQEVPQEVAPEGPYTPEQVRRYAAKKGAVKAEVIAERLNTWARFEANYTKLVRELGIKEAKFVRDVAYRYRALLPDELVSPT